MAAQIVVVEDEPSVQELLRDVLEPEGYNILSVSHPNALEIQPTDDIDLILVDLMLPETSGVQLAGQLRQSGFAHTPIIAMSASKILLHVAEESALFQETIAKPFDLSTLLESVRHYAGRYVI